MKKNLFLILILQGFNYTKNIIILWSENQGRERIEGNHLHHEVACAPAND